MTTLWLCYFGLFFFANKSKLRVMMTSWCGIVATLALIAIVGLVYRGNNMVFVPAYILIYFNADRIKNHVIKHQRATEVISFVILIFGYIYMSFDLEHAFRYGIYMRFMVTCIMALVTITFFQTVLSRNSGNRIVNYLANISMEIYLIHHLFVYDQPLYISLPLTLILSDVLYRLSKILNKWIISITCH